MASSSANLALSRTRSLRAPPSSSTSGLKLSSALTSTAGSGPPYPSLFLTNLRLLDLDLRKDWPGITTAVLVSKDGRKRIQCVEWALYQLFAIWDPEEARNKLQPFFPPLEPLQSLNLRAALYRCLDAVKKNGVLGRDTVLRKTMLDECKGERLEEVLAVFSNAVLERVVQEGNAQSYPAVAQILASENFSYSGERTILSSLILAHKASLSRHLGNKNASREKYRDFSELLNLNHRRSTRRHEQLKESVEENGSNINISQREVTEIHEKFQKNWSGNSEWTESILFGDCTDSKGGLLSTRFEDVWKHVEKGTIGDLEGKKNAGLLEQLDARVKDQAARLAKWQAFGKMLEKKDKSPVKKSQPASQAPKMTKLNFDKHQILQMRTKPVEVSEAAPLQDDYQRLLENMKIELENVDKPRPRNPRTKRQSVYEDKSLLQEDKVLLLEDKSLVYDTKRRSLLSPPLKEDISSHEEDNWSSASEDSEGQSPGFNATKSSSQTPPSEAAPEHRMLSVAPSDKNFLPTSESEINTDSEEDTILAASTPRKMSQPKSRTPPREILSKPVPSLDPEADLLADEILNSMAAASPSPKKARHHLSLAERTRLSMARSSHSQISDLHEDFDLEDAPRLSIKPKTSSPLRSPSEIDPHADLIERTRRSMAGFEAAQKKAQVERRRSVKAAKKKERESSYFPKVEQSIPEDVDPSILIEGSDPDYESVFKSRPKIKTSPAVSPTKEWSGGEDE
ncbi:hypothetical protein BP6252_13518 [Coleophoma cylindrospora]|uniref:HAUS augmin-like complex subunit 6 N-terminal domain-containing protein n=1 Tax=Coleophoma cylindrospora TaxID=1849047 RepID=A0A3D8Q8W8_9HELO|nr:hypothetical protein BP6252_13518 [Coleophoma cylindrospora]